MKVSTLPLLVAFLLLSSLSNSQDAPTADRSRDMIQPMGRMEAAKHQQQMEPPVAPRPQAQDPVKLRQEADELSRLAQSVPLDIDQVAQGKLPKDVADKLKRIEKLSKHLRGALAP